MESLAWSLLVAAPVVVCAVLGLLLRRLWQRIAFTGFGAAAIYALLAYGMQRDLAARLAGATARDGTALQVAEPLRIAAEVALVTLPIGLCAGFLLTLSTRFIRTKMA